MWRLSTILPKSGGVIVTSRSGRRCCFGKTRSTAALRAGSTAASVSAPTSTSTNTVPNFTNNYPPQRRAQRLFHTTASRSNIDRKKIRSELSASWDIDDIDPDDPDDIPDLLDNQFRSLEDDDNDREEEEEEEERGRYRIQQEKVNDELDSRKGRPWEDPWAISEEQWMASDTSQESLPDWSPSFVSRISLERLQVLPAGPDGIPTLQILSDMSLPASAASLHPSRETKTYAAYRKSRHYESVTECVNKLAKDRVAKLLQDAAASKTVTNDWNDRQDAIDALFEELQEDAKNDASMDILSKHPEFPRWVERALEECLRTASQTELQQKVEKGDVEKEGDDANGSKDDKKEEDVSVSEKNTEEAAAASPSPSPSPFKENVPIFMDCYNATDVGSSSDGDAVTGPMVPKILSPLGPHRHGGPGRMVEEWELSAHQTTKRIMLRDCTRQIAQVLLTTASDDTTTTSSSPTIYVHGHKGTGKSAVLASVVASARTSGYIVMYLPDGDRLRKNGFFITPNAHREGMFDLQDLSQEALKQLAESQNADQMTDMVADRATLETYFKDTQLKRVDEYRASLNDDAETSEDDDSMSLIDLMNYAQEHKKHAPMCYSVVVNRLMHQTKIPFLIVMDEFNCLYDHGHYFHMAYDEDVRKAIPYDRISLFEPIMAAMNLTIKSAEEEEDAVAAEVDGEEVNDNAAAAMMNAAVIVGTTESHSIRREITDALTDCAQRRSSSHNTAVFEVPRFSSLEVDHILANFEATGVGKLRLDRGDTLMNPQEVEYLKMASGSIGQKLLDVSIF